MARVAQIFAILFAFLVLGNQLSTVSAVTNPDDDSALRSMYIYFGLPPQLSGWSLKGGDPCGSPSWSGVSCSGSRIESINLKGLGVGGIITPERLSNFTSLKSLDLSKNKIVGNIPYPLPPNVTHIHLQNNQFTGCIPEQFKVVPDLRTDGNNINCCLEPSAPTKSDEETPNHARIMFYFLGLVFMMRPLFSLKA